MNIGVQRRGRMGGLGDRRGVYRGLRGEKETVEDGLEGVV